MKKMIAMDIGRKTAEMVHGFSARLRTLGWTAAEIHEAVAELVRSIGSTQVFGWNNPAMNMDPKGIMEAHLDSIERLEGAKGEEGSR